jgi:hypothetical protein
MAVFTVALAGIFSALSTYYAASFQMKQATFQKQFEYRAKAYSAFLEKIDRVHSPIFAELLNIGSLADHIATDNEIQFLENRLAYLLKKTSPQDLYWQLNSDFKLLQLHGTVLVHTRCEDILKLLVFRDSEVNWSDYQKPIRDYYQRWRDASSNGIEYGFEAKVSNDEWRMIIVVSRLFQSLISQLRSELMQTQMN